MVILHVVKFNEHLICIPVLCYLSFVDFGGSFITPTEKEQDTINGVSGNSCFHAALVYILSAILFETFLLFYMYIHLKRCELLFFTYTFQFSSSLLIAFGIFSCVHMISIKKIYMNFDQEFHFKTTERANYHSSAKVRHFKSLIRKT